MSAKTTSSKSKSTGKTAAKSKAKATPKPKTRLAGPKPPKARSTASKGGTVSKPVTAASVAAARDARPSTSKIPAPDVAKKPAAAAEPAMPDELKKRELVDLVVARSDVKKKYAKPVVEALLEVLGETLAKGREMNLQPFGKVKYNRTKETPSARVVVAKFRQSKPSKPAQADKSSLAQDTVADAAE